MPSREVIPVSTEELSQVRVRARPYGIMVFESPLPHKRFTFKHPETGARVHFGSPLHENFLIHRNPERRAAFRTRMGGLKLSDGRRAVDVEFTPAWAAYHLLW